MVTDRCVCCHFPDRNQQGSTPVSAARGRARSTAARPVGPKTPMLRALTLRAPTLRLPRQKRKPQPRRRLPPAAHRLTPSPRGVRPPRGRRPDSLLPPPLWRPHPQRGQLRALLLPPPTPMPPAPLPDTTKLRCGVRKTLVPPQIRCVDYRLCIRCDCRNAAWGSGGGYPRLPRWCTVCRPRGH